MNIKSIYSNFKFPNPLKKVGSVVGRICMPPVLLCLTIILLVLSVITYGVSWILTGDGDKYTIFPIEQLEKKAELYGGLDACAFISMLYLLIPIAIVCFIGVIANIIKYH